MGLLWRLRRGVNGLIHISEVADSFVKDVNDYLKENDIVKAKVISISKDGKISLSLRKANENAKTKQVDQSFEDKLAKFLKDSEERMLDIKRYHESKRGSGSYGRRKVL